MLQLFNTLSRQKEEFKTIEPGKVHLYSCGPTVYDYAHIGNFRAFMLADLLKRYLRYRGFEVFHVMNITDLEDKILQRVREDEISLQDLTNKYTEIFFAELDELNIERADLYPRATEHVEEMIQLISLSTILKADEKLVPLIISFHFLLLYVLLYHRDKEPMILLYLRMFPYPMLL